MLASVSTARQAGDVHYFTGRPCKSGHVAVRYASNGGCVDCGYSESKRQLRREHYARHAARERERSKSRKRAWLNLNPHRHCEQAARRRARKRNQVCTCCSREEIAELYRAAQLTGGEVDHRIPLALGGMHCSKNMQVLTEAAHKAKTAVDVLAIKQRRVAGAAQVSHLHRS